MEINFKNWLETLAPPKPETDPTVLMAKKNAMMAMQNAIKKKQNPIIAAQQAVAKSNVPVNKIGKVMPTVPDEDTNTNV